MRLLLAIWLGKLILFLSRLLGRGGGSAAPGYYALKLCPNLNSRLAKQIPQNVVITGTNGKTTTARLLDHFVKAQNLKVVRNATGSNLNRGVASTLIAASNWLGQIQADLGLWELDEAAFNTVVFELKPQIIVFLNAFRDQLDRYGEVDTVVKKWQASLAKIDWETALVVNGGDNHTWTLIKNDKLQMTNAKFYEFRVKNHQMAQEKNLSGDQKHQDDFAAEITQNKGLSGLEFDLKFPDEKLRINLPIPGIYHVYDFLAAFSAYYLLNLPLKDINDRLQSYLPAFGRVEKVKLQDHEAFIFLIKNPTGATEVFSTIAPEFKPGDRLLIALNDNFADGKDVSWIWDAEFEQLVVGSKSSNIKQKPKKTNNPGPITNGFLAYCSGSRAQDLAIRLKYAGIATQQLIVINDLSRALAEAQKGLSGRLFILPTYTALLELQGILTKNGVKSHYWVEST